MQSSILECITRLRQCACAVELVPPARLAAARRLAESFARALPAAGGSGGGGGLTLEEARRLFETLRGLAAEGEEGRECVVCLESLDGPRLRLLRACRHYFCAVCVGRLLDDTGASA